MSGRRSRQSEFLRHLLRCGDGREHHELDARMNAAEKDVRSMHRACKVVGFTALGSLVGLGYCAVLHPDFFGHTLPPSVRILRALALGSGLSFLTFWAMSRWYGAALERLHEQARHLVMRFVQSSREVSLPPAPILDRTLSQTGTPANAEPEDDKIIRLPKAS
ncbi:MAG: hypothetical protein RJA22_3054 [Verrucomicrobiota bacterium]|jgi:hypothetical protein